MKAKFFISIFLLVICQSNWANNYRTEMSLHGRWNFKIGDNPNWAKPNFDDSNWDRINVPGRWEEQGYQGYDGYAWYRKKVEIPASFSDRTLYLELGYIDDVDEVFFNGTKIGQTGSFPPNYLTAYNAYRKYEIPLELVNYGKSNTISVRVYDSQLEGGIVQKHVRIGVSDIAITPDINLSGLWNFNTGKEINRSKQVEILVPGQWENQGFNNYDGYAVYQRKFNLPPDMVNKRMIFLAGRIDDFDQLYINGKFIAQTGDFEKPNTFDKHAEFRNYFIPPGILKTGENEVIIKIYDGRGEGGILEGNVGLITQDKFIKLWKMRRK